MPPPDSTNGVTRTPARAPTILEAAANRVLGGDR